MNEKKILEADMKLEEEKQQKRRKEEELKKRMEEEDEIKGKHLSLKEEV